MTKIAEIITKTPKETKMVGRILAKEVLRLENNGKGALNIALNGELGAGKTTFVQGFVLGFGIKEEITSPTFLIMKKIELHKHKLQTIRQLADYKPWPGRLQTNFKSLYHLDCYRLKNEKDLIDLDIKEIFANPENIVLIEWAEKIKKILPKETIKINFKYINKKEREMDIKF